jgi:DNA-binding CsgD family transcriptional regulator
MMEFLLPYLDIALRRIAPFPHLSAHRADSAGGRGHGLSERESEIMDWVGKGKTNAEIGNILSISEFTVRNHLYHIFQKLGVYNRTQAASKITQAWGMRSEQRTSGASGTLFPQTTKLPLADGL